MRNIFLPESHLIFLLIRARLVEGKDRLAALPSLPLTELTAMAQVAENIDTVFLSLMSPKFAQVSPTEKMPAASIRKLAQERTASSVSTMESEVKLCTATVEGLAFLLWRHLEHFLLYTRLPFLYFICLFLK